MNLYIGAATAGTKKVVSSSTTLKTRKLDEETENLARKYISISDFSFDGCDGIICIRS